MGTCCDQYDAGFGGACSSSSSTLEDRSQLLVEKEVSHLHHVQLWFDCHIGFDASTTDVDFVCSDSQSNVGLCGCSNLVDR